MDLRILFIARNYPPDVGGAEKLNYDLARYLRKYADVEVIPNRFGKYSPIFYVYAIFRSIGISADVVLLSDALLSPLIPVFKLIKRVPVVVKVHGLDITYSNPVYQLFIPRMTNIADKVICISDATRYECVKRGINHDKCVVIPVGIEPGEVVLPGNKDEHVRAVEDITGVKLSDRKIILSVGRLVERKGFHWFVESVMPELVQLDGDIVYLIAGDGPYRDVIENIVISKNLKDNVILLGKVDRNTLRLLYNAADVFVMPNIPVNGDLEGFGIVVLEASSCGVPVVASNIDGIKDAVLNGKSGILVDAYDSNGFIEAICKLINDKRMSNSENVKKSTYNSFRLDKISFEYIKHFKLMLK